MTFLDLVRSRSSVRAYKPDPVPQSILNHVLEAARLAPSACNLQPYHFAVITEPDLRKKVCAAYRDAWLAGAPVLVVACSEPKKAWCRRSDGKNHADIDLAIAVDHMTLAAAEAGLGTCWVCAFDTVLVRRVLNVPASHEPVALLPIGYPAVEGQPAKERRPLMQMVGINYFHGVQAG